MGKALVLVGAAGVVCVLAALVAFAMAMGQRGQWGMVVWSLLAFAFITFLMLVGIEFAGDFWEGR